MLPFALVRTVGSTSRDMSVLACCARVDVRWVTCSPQVPWQLSCMMQAVWRRSVGCWGAEFGLLEAGIIEFCRWFRLVQVRLCSRLSFGNLCEAELSFLCHWVGMGPRAMRQGVMALATSGVWRTVLALEVGGRVSILHLPPYCDV